MYTLNPCFKNLYTLQASFIFYHVAIRSYWDEINPSVYDFEFKEQKKAFPLSKRQCDNFVARLLGHDSNSSVIALTNPNSKHSQWLFDAFQMNFDFKAQDPKRGFKSTEVAEYIANNIPNNLLLDAECKSKLIKSLQVAIYEMPSSEQIDELRDIIRNDLSDEACLVLSCLGDWTDCQFQSSYEGIDEDGDSVTIDGYYLTELSSMGDSEFRVPFTPEFDTIQEFSEHLASNAQTYLKYALIDPGSNDWRNVVDSVNALL